MDGTTSIGVKLYQGGKKVPDCQSFPDLMGDTDKIESAKRDRHKVTGFWR